MKRLKWTFLGLLVLTAAAPDVAVGQPGPPPMPPGPPPMEPGPPMGGLPGPPMGGLPGPPMGGRRVAHGWVLAHPVPRPAAVLWDQAV
jgi:hypothetical protein